MNAAAPSEQRQELRVPLQAWLAERLGAKRVQVSPFTAPSGGYSAETLLFDAHVEAADGTTATQRYVLRRELPEPPVYPQQVPGTLDVEVDIQYRVMAAVAAHSNVPIAPLVGYESDESVLGGQFFVMGYVGGDVPREDPIYTREGFYAQAQPSQRHRLLDAGLGLLADLHRMDWQAAQLGFLVAGGDQPGTATQVRIWRDYADRELDGRHHPEMEAGFALLAEVPADHRLCLNWGDGRPGNIIWQDFRPACAMDFEAACIASPLVDLGWWLMFDRWSHEAMGVPHPEGRLSRSEQRDMYARHAGVEVGDTTWYEIFAAVRYCAIVVRVINRTVRRGELPSDNEFWRENPSTACLRHMLNGDCEPWTT